MKRKISFIQFVNAGFVPGLGQLPKTLPSPSRTLMLDMWASEPGVTVKVNSVEVFMPWHNVSNVVFEAEKPKAAPEAEKSSGKSE